MESYSKLLTSYLKLRKRTYSLSERILVEGGQFNYLNRHFPKGTLSPEEAEILLMYAKNPQPRPVEIIWGAWSDPENPENVSWLAPNGEVHTAPQQDLIGYLEGVLKGEDEVMGGGEDAVMPPEAMRGEEIAQDAELLSTVDLNRLREVGAKHGLVFSEDDLEKQEDLNQKLNKNVLAGYGTLRATFALVFGDLAPYNEEEDPDPSDAVKEMNSDFNHLVDILDGIEDDDCVDFDSLSDGQRLAVERFTIKQNSVWYGGNHEAAVKPAILKQVAQDNSDKVGNKGGALEGETLRHLKQYGVKLFGGGNTYQQDEIAANKVKAGTGLSPQARIVMKLGERVRCNSGNLPLIRGTSSTKTAGLSRARGEVDEILMQATPLLMKVLSLPHNEVEMRRKVIEVLAEPVKDAIKHMESALVKWASMVDVCWNGEDSDAMIVGEEADSIREFLDHLPWKEWGAGNFERVARATVLQFLKDNIQAMNAITAAISQSDVAGVVHTTSDGTKISSISGTRKVGKSILGAAGFSDTAETEKADTLLGMKTPDAALKTIENFGGGTTGVRARQATHLGVLGISQKVYGPEINSDAKFDSHYTVLGKMSQAVRATEEGIQVAQLNKQALKERAALTGEEFDESAFDEAAAWDRESIESVSFALDRPGPALGPDSPEYSSESGKVRGSLGNLIADLREEFKSCDNEDDLARELNLIIDGGYRSATKKNHPGLSDLQKMDVNSKEYAKAKADMMSRIPMLRAAMKAREIPGNSAHNRKARRFRGAYFAYQTMCGIATSEQIMQIRVFGGRTYTTTQSALVDDLAIQAMSGENVSIGPRNMQASNSEGKVLGFIDTRVISGAAKAHLKVSGFHIRRTVDEKGIVQETKADKLMVMFSALLEEMGLVKT